MTVEILLAAYNGERYLREQLDSILAQDFADWHLTIADDCSRDNTARLALEYAERYPQKITALRRETGTGSARANFAALLREADGADYIAFSDQDDVWLPDKLSAGIAELRRLESEYGKETPLLVHSDMAVVNETMDVTASSFFRFQGLNKRARSLSRIAAQNNVTGCTMMVNHALQSRFAAADSSGMLMHDWWLALIAAAFGRIGFVDRPLMYYRQHGDNQVGAVGNNARTQAKRSASEGGAGKRLERSYNQAAAFLSQYGGELDADSRLTLGRFAALRSKSKPVRIYTILRYGYRKQSMLTLLGQLLYC